MKRMKRIVSVMLAMVMVLGMGVTAFAANTHEHIITINGNSDDKGTHTYQAYQIFAGDLADNPEYKKLTCDEDHDHTDECYTVDTNAQKYVLSNIIWGSGVKDGDALLAALQADEAFIKDGKNLFAECTTAEKVAEVVATFASSSKNDATLADEFAKVVSGFLSEDYFINGNGQDAEPNEIHVNGSGYYLIKDMDASLEADEAAYTRLLLQVVGDATVVVKSEVPSGEKKVFYAGADALGQAHTHVAECYDTDGNLICGRDEFTYDPSQNRGDANNAGIGDHVTFEITSKVPNYVGYDYYYFIMNDTMSNGLTFDGTDTVTVKIGGETLQQGTKSELTCTNEDADHVHGSECYDIDGDYYVYEDGEHSFRLAFKDIMEKNADGTQKWAVGAEIIVTYSAQVNENAVIGTSGNTNTWSLEYSRDPNEEYRPGVDWGNPGLPLEEENTVLGKTPDDITLTYVTELDITKYADAIDEANLLEGAEFTLTGTSYQIVTNTVKYYTEDANGTFYRLMNGTYTTQEPTDIQYVEIGVGTETTTTGYIKDASGTYVVPTDKTAYVGETLYKRVKGTADQYADLNVKYREDTATETKMVPVDVAIELTTDKTGKISFKGLGAGEYTLTETVTPAGYNTIEPIHFEIKWDGPTGDVTTGNEKCTWTITWDDARDTGLSADGTGTATGIFAANVINVSGLLLPSTGGIGTTIFYVTGSILVLAAVVLLVTKKRMVKEK